MKGKNGKMKNHLGAERAPALFGELSQMIQLTKKSCNSHNADVVADFLTNRDF